MRAILKGRTKSSDFVYSHGSIRSRASAQRWTVMGMEWNKGGGLNGIDVGKFARRDIDNHFLGSQEINGTVSIGDVKMEYKKKGTNKTLIFSDRDGQNDPFETVDAERDSRVKFYQKSSEATVATEGVPEGGNPEGEGQNDPSNNITLQTKNVITENVTTPVFYPGWDGKGFGITTDKEGETTIVADNIFARKKFEVNEFVHKRVKAVGGELFITTGGKEIQKAKRDYQLLSSEGVTLLSASDGSFIEIPKPRGSDRQKAKTDRKNVDEIHKQVDEGKAIATVNIGNPIKIFPEDAVEMGSPDYEVGDLIIARYLFNQRLYTAKARVYKVGSDCVYLWAANSFPMTDNLTWVRVGSATNRDRQAFIVLSGVDEGSPCIRMRANIGSWADFDSIYTDMVGNKSTLPVLIGKLEGYTVPKFGMLTGYGLYSNNCFLTGNFCLDNGRSLATIDQEQVLLKNTSDKHGESLINLEDGEITLKAGKTKILDGNGKESLLIENGKVKAEHIEVDNLVARQINTSLTGVGRRIQINKSSTAFEMFDDKNRRTLLIDDGSGAGQIAGIAIQDPSNANNIMQASSSNIFIRSGNTSKGNPVMQLSSDLLAINAYGKDCMLNPSQLSLDKVHLSATTFKLPSDAVMDVPGVLSTGTVDDYGGLYSSTQWGCINCTLDKMSTGHFRLRHDLNHADYYLQLTPNSFWGDHGIVCVTAFNKGLTTIDVYVSTIDGDALDKGFNYQLTGRKR